MKILSKLIKDSFPKRVKVSCLNRKSELADMILADSIVNDSIRSDVLTFLQNLWFLDSENKIDFILCVMNESGLNNDDLFNIRNQMNKSIGPQQ